jgi:hypothetical protein
MAEFLIDSQSGPMVEYAMLILKPLMLDLALDVGYMFLLSVAERNQWVVVTESETTAQDQFLVVR